MDGLSASLLYGNRMGRKQKVLPQVSIPTIFYWTMGKCLEIEEVMRKHISIMDKYDPQKKVALMVDGGVPGGTKSRELPEGHLSSKTPT